MSGTRVLIVGGYGIFGGRLAQLLADEARLTLIIAGRARDRAEAFCAALRPQGQREARLGPLAFDLADGSGQCLSLNFRPMADSRPEVPSDAGQGQT